MESAGIEIVEPGYELSASSKVDAVILNTCGFIKDAKEESVQAVLEGVMMKNKDRYAVAVRKPNGEIDVEISNYQGILEERKINEKEFLIKQIW